MDRRVIEEKLESLRRCYRRIEEKRPDSAEEFQDNYDLQDIVSVNIERAVQLCVDIGTHIIAESDYSAPSSLGETFEILEKMEVTRILE
ncbi:MAG: HepT-like ribonuclease domain-containing protein [Balneolaceae bacterium]|nr:HepT-like ribonuclease domain-containing protein [Balneolaceae bacterium]